MQTIKIILLLLLFFPYYGQAQNKSKSSDQTRTIEINNDKGDLYISFVNGEISEFTVNDEAVPKDQFDNYQNIIDDFAGEEVQSPAQPEPPAPPAEDEVDQNEQLRTMITNYLIDEGIINSGKKLKVQLKSKFMKVNGKSQSQQVHEDCLSFFEEIYEHELNERSEVKFKKSKRNSSSSISIVE